jgi:hypothetical protein
MIKINLARTKWSGAYKYWVLTKWGETEGEGWCFDGSTGTIYDAKSSYIQYLIHITVPNYEDFRTTGILDDISNAN